MYCRVVRHFNKITADDFRYESTAVRFCMPSDVSRLSFLLAGDVPCRRQCSAGNSEG